MFWGLWHCSVYHTVNVIKSKSCQYLLAKGGSLSLLLKQPSICLIGLWSQAVPDMTQALEEAAQTEVPWTQPHAVFNTIWPSQGDLEAEDKTYCVFVYVQKCDKRSFNPSRLPHTISVFAVIFFLDRGAQLWQIADTMYTIKHLVSAEYWKQRRNTDLLSGGFSVLMVQRSNRKTAAWNIFISF